MLHLRAPAKINLYLQVLSRRPDGYHELATWMQKLVLADDITLTATRSGVTLECRGADLATDARNLACRAALLFFQETGLPGGVAITLVKNIPVAAGLGGGSSDAAAVLTGLNRLYAAGLTERKMMELGLGLGADVPFFVAGCPAALATGIGEKLEERQPLSGYRVVLVNPGFPVSTKWVYENFDQTQTVPFALTTEDNAYILGRAFAGSLAPANFFNDLERVTTARYPEVGRLKKELADAGAAVALMSGSGPTVFGIFTDPDLAAQSAATLRHRYPGGVFLTEPLSS
jgi:4-diphosphocytidyl-2-C-methyl-D-erythritol kinase